MSQHNYKASYKRKLPHFQPPGATLFVTCRLAGSIPQAVREQLEAEAVARTKRMPQIDDLDERAVWLDQEQKRRFGAWDNVLDRAESGPVWLQQPEIARIVAESLHNRDGQTYALDAYCIMPNHVHIVLTPLEKPDGTYYAFQAIMHAFKLHTARQANKLLGREGQFWQHESYDHVVRDRQEWERIVRYVLNNPVKAGLAGSWEDWAWTYLKT